MNGIQDKESGLNESNGDILFKINSILHNKLDLGDFFGPDSNNNHPSQRNGVCSDLEKGESLLDDDKGHLDRKRPAPLSLGDASRLSDILGLSSASPKQYPHSHSANTIRTFKSGEFKFPDVSSPLARLRYGGGGGGGDGAGVASSSANHFNFNNSASSSNRLSTDAGSPTFDEAILMGVSDKWDIVGRQSPGSDGAYGTSYSSNLTGSVPIRGTTSREHDSGISDIFKGLGLNESSCSRVGSYCGSTSSVGAGSSLLDSPPPPLPRQAAISLPTEQLLPPPMPSISEMDPAVAQAVKNIQNLQNLQSLCNYNNENEGGAGTSSSLERARSKDKNIQLSCKVFLGGVPWDITEGALLSTFKPFGPIKIEWPGKENSSQVKDLLNACTHDYGNGGSWYYKISSRRMRNKEVQVIPWVISDSNFVRCPSQRLDPKKTVFVGALHGMLTAEGLCSIFQDLFGGVVYAGVDTDKYKYPQGSGRVTFNNHRSYMKAVSAAFIEIKAPKFTKKVQVDPYLEDELCSTCGLRQGPYFCRDQACFKYFCRYCWELYHGIEMSHHNPLMRNSKPNNPMRTVPVNLPFTD
ncbi:CPEB [Lepeophtheirus salmonis]|uniref:CPEB n=1 Tax=Lepeophtheirus salmonis TaxID=72036 RepID=A0A7R8GZT4_LEPSM|nr:CPEB [Lepeophtheirus salmonis]CAF2758024.1 CPEB [Lepeophtheirus salmonis]